MTSRKVTHRWHYGVWVYNVPTDYDWLYIRHITCFPSGSTPPYCERHCWIIQGLASAALCCTWLMVYIPCPTDPLLFYLGNAPYSAFPLWTAPFLDPTLSPFTALGPQCHDVVAWLYSAVAVIRLHVHAAPVTELMEQMHSTEHSQQLLSGRCVSPFCACQDSVREYNRLCVAG